jgi:hypothetical protein
MRDVKQAERICNILIWVAVIVTVYHMSQGTLNFDWIKWVN